MDPCDRVLSVADTNLAGLGYPPSARTTYCVKRLSYQVRNVELPYPGRPQIFQLSLGSATQVASDRLISTQPQTFASQSRANGTSLDYSQCIRVQRRHSSAPDLCNQTNLVFKF